MAVINYAKKEIEEEISEVLPYNYDITSYGIDFTVDMIVDRMRKGTIFVPQFQRAFVWDLKKSSRFIESLLLGLPVPGVFLSKEFDSQKLLIIDGQQRLKSLLYFYDGIFEPTTTNQPFLLKDVQAEYEGLGYKELSADCKTKLDNCVIHATIIKQDKPYEIDSSSIYYIFERINTGGLQLAPQEIRSAIFHGEFRNLLHSLNDYGKWREIYGKKSKRLRDEELILRFFAMYYRVNEYSPPLKKFLNDYMESNRKLQNQSAQQLTTLFENTISTMYSIMGVDSFKYKRGILASIADSTMVGIAKRLERGPIKDTEAAKATYLNLLSQMNYSNAVLEHTADKLSVETRLREATKAFADAQ